MELMTQVPVSFAAIDIAPILIAFGYVIYAAMAIAAVFGLYSVVALMRQVKKRSFPGKAASETFLDDVGEQLEKNDFEGVFDTCDVPELWSRAVPQLVQFAVENKNKPIKKVKQMTGEKFSRDVLAQFENRNAWVNTIVKSAPMLGLLGTVTGMIAAFGKIAGSGESGVKPSDLANDISFALFTTAYGLAIAIPLVILGAMAQTRIARLQDSVEESMGYFFDDLEAAQVRSEG